MSDHAQEDKMWLLQRIGVGRGNPVTLRHLKLRDAALLEALEEEGLVVVGSARRGYRASIVDKGREALARSRVEWVQDIEKNYGRVSEEKHA